MSIAIFIALFIINVFGIFAYFPFSGRNPLCHDPHRPFLRHYAIYIAVICADALAFIFLPGWRIALIACAFLPSAYVVCYWLDYRRLTCTVAYGLKEWTNRLGDVLREKSYGHNTWYSIDGCTRIHYKSRNGFERWYDRDGNLILETKSDGTWRRLKYGPYGRPIYDWNSKGEWAKWAYNAMGRVTHYLDSKGKWGRMVYDACGHCVYEWDSEGHWKKWVYDASGNCVYEWDFCEEVDEAQVRR